MIRRSTMICMTGAKPRLLRSGFSLLEILIVTLLFAMASIVLSQTYISFNKLHRRVANTAVLSQDMRFAMEFLVREARNKSIDFDAYLPGEAASTTALYLKSQSVNERVAIQSGASCADPSGASCLALSLDGGTTWNPITSARVNVKKFNVYVRPTVSPFVEVGGAFPNNVQPMVTFDLELEYLGTNPQDNVTLEAQTTVSSRVYQR